MSSKNAKKKSGPTARDQAEREEIEALIAPFVDTFAEDPSYEWVSQRGGWVFTFSSLHLPPGGAVEVKKWELTTTQARWFLTGCLGMGAWMVNLHSMAAEHEFPEADQDARSLPTWDGEEWGEASVVERLPEGVEVLAEFCQDPDKNASPQQDLRSLERVTLLQETAQTAQMNLVARLTKRGAGDGQIAAASAMTLPALRDFRQAIIGSLGDLSHMGKWANQAAERRVAEEADEGA